MIIIHGPDQVSALKKLDQLLDQAQRKSQEIEKIEGKTLSPASLSQSLTSSSLFSSSRFIVINDLLSLPQSNNKKKLIDILKKTSHQDLVFYETKNIHPATIKSLPTSQVYQFKESPLIFKLLDQLSPGKPQHAFNTLKEIVSNKQSLEMLFFMLIRHVRQLIQAKTPGSLGLPPWQLSKINKQSSLFTTDQLINLHKQLYKVDKRQKTSSVKDLKLQLELCILNLTAHETRT
jgi:DNA polymerase III delta subunit